VRKRSASREYDERRLERRALFLSLLIFASIGALIWSLIPYSSPDTVCGVGARQVVAEDWDHDHFCWQHGVPRAIATGGSSLALLACVFIFARSERRGV
jgi:hypothetical protein